MIHLTMVPFSQYTLQQKIHTHAYIYKGTTVRSSSYSSSTNRHNEGTTQNTTSSSDPLMAVWTIIDDHQTSCSILWPVSRSEKVVIAHHHGCNLLDCWRSSV